MNVCLRIEIIEKLSARGILAYVAMAMTKGSGGTVQALAASVHTTPEIMESCLVEFRKVQDKMEVFPSKKKSKRALHVEEDAFELPLWVDKEAWDAFDGMRTAIGKPMTNRARRLIVKKLMDMGGDTTAILDKSYINRWQDVFPLKVEDRPAAKRVSAVKETEFRL